MRFYLDENFPLLASEHLRSLGHEVFRALEFHPPGTADRKLFEDAQHRGAIFLTTDKDFFHTIPFFFPQRVAPVISITLAQAKSANILARLESLMNSVHLESDKDAVYLVTDRKIVRRS
jgi:predicted nuclease of predicted toxin-antitoxin system